LAMWLSLSRFAWLSAKECECCRVTAHTQRGEPAESPGRGRARAKRAAC